MTRPSLEEIEQTLVDVLEAAGLHVDPDRLAAIRKARRQRSAVEYRNIAIRAEPSGQ